MNRQAEYDEDVVKAMNCAAELLPDIHHCAEYRGDFIKRIRKDVRMTCRELAGALGVSVGRLSDIEHGREPAGPTFTVAAALVCTAKLMFKRSDVYTESE